jgi:hypothetical protein
MSPSVLSPQDWQEAGSLPTDKTVFGITGLRLEEGNSGDAEVSYTASYQLWLPASSLGAADNAEESGDEPVMPAAINRRDQLRLIRDKKGLWHIAEIGR